MTTGKIVAFSIFEKVRAFAASARSAVLCAGALAHEHAVLRCHELLAADYGKSQFNRRFFRQFGNLRQVQLGGKPYTARAKLCGLTECEFVGDGQVRPRLDEPALRHCPREHAEALRYDRLVGVHTSPRVEATCLLARKFADVVAHDGEHNRALLRVACLLDGCGQLARHRCLAVLKVDSRNVQHVSAGALRGFGASGIRYECGNMNAAHVGRTHIGKRLDTRKRTGGHAFEQLLLEGFERRCAHMMQLGEADADSFIDFDDERCELKRRLAHAVDVGANVRFGNRFRTGRLDVWALGNAHRQRLAGEALDGNPIGATVARRVCQAKLHAQGLPDSQASNTIDEHARQLVVVDERRLRATHAKDAVALAHSALRRKQNVALRSSHLPRRV